MDSTSNMKSLAQIMNFIENEYTYIPLIQRNYKWSMECASELAEDLWDSYINDKERPYQLNMITIYNNSKEQSLQILDGQQRLITLKLFLAFLESKSINLNYAFERDFKIDERNGRRHFIDYYLKKDDTFKEDIELSVDIKRLYDNFISMIIPISFRSIYLFYGECLDKAANESRKAEDIFKERLTKNVIEPRLASMIDNKVLDEVKLYMNIDEDVCLDMCKLCENFQKLFSMVDTDDEVSNDEIRISVYSYQFQKIWSSRIRMVINKLGIEAIVSNNKKKELTKYINEKVEMLYHETLSQPIDEFLNINENKTRFVISDYIRANMISDNPIDGNIDNETKNIHQNNRNKILNIFSSLANYLYNTNYETMWELVKQRYDDFDKHPDINRLKILFCDKYAGTSTKGYSFEIEIKRLEYFEIILKSLVSELEIENVESNKHVIWNTYNAVYILLECKKKYRFFNLFTQNDIDKNSVLKDVAARERFCFFEWAYEFSKSSDDFWDISYFLESQLYTEKCDKKKADHLPKKQDEDWCYINRGIDGDELHKCIEQLINSIKESSCDG
ncbi:DUF262 domain-containing protein [Paenibacillus sp. FSL R10-2199]|uniref:DUF262 domain-containing protein n=1 Tax=Paenibacillus sp. FSL R10-2199 TaxID=2975348 RepID=UPI0030F7E4E1